jgi:hypothetical protein
LPNPSQWCDGIRMGAYLTAALFDADN